MPVTVTLHVFSGRPDPTWTISDQDAAALEAEVAKLERPTLAKPPGSLGRLGYRGFTISGGGAAATGGAPTSLYVHEGVVDRGVHDVNVVDEARDLERRLLGTATAQKILQPEVLQHVRAEIERPAQVHPEAQIAAARGGPVAEIERQPQAFQPFPFPWPWPWPPKPGVPAVPRRRRARVPAGTLEHPDGAALQQLLQLREQPHHEHVRAAGPRARQDVHDLTVLWHGRGGTGGGGRRPSGVPELQRAAPARQGLLRRAGDLAERRFPLVPSGQGGLLVAQTGQHGGAKRGQQRSPDHRPEDRGPRRLHELLHVHGDEPRSSN